ncbi:hypothetical protein FSP39_015578 [Pinctada imbricata]|uniref:CCHC-type domain-containing protein n=1 Tax=Pinctada imbricata TaxID=66713 RepID=A0AA88YLT9_PINIB|nr:hypothetical protein FSP39_015578 [Pinctada imbricata]
MRYRPITDKKSPKVVLGILVEVFGERATASELLSDFYQTKQTDAQTLQEFSHLIMSKLDRVNRIERSLTANRDAMLRNQFAENVFEPWLRHELKKIIRTHKDIAFSDLREEAILLSQDLEKPRRKVEIYEEKAVASAQEVKGSEVAEIWHFLKNELREIRKEVAEIKSSQKKEVQCYKCRELGHIKRNCPLNQSN